MKTQALDNFPSLLNASEDTKSCREKVKVSESDYLGQATSV